MEHRRYGHEYGKQLGALVDGDQSRAIGVTIVSHLAIRRLELFVYKRSNSFQSENPVQGRVDDNCNELNKGVRVDK